MLSRLGGLGPEASPERSSEAVDAGEEEWEDLDPDAGRAAEVERKKRICLLYTSPSPRD